MSGTVPVSVWIDAMVALAVFAIVAISSPFLLYHAVVRKRLFMYTKWKWVHNIGFSRMRRVVFRFPLQFTPNRWAFELGANRNLSPETFRKIADVTLGQDVRMSLADNPSTPTDVLLRIVEMENLADENKRKEKKTQSGPFANSLNTIDVQTVTRRYLICHPNLPEDERVLLALQWGWEE